MSTVFPCCYTEIPTYGTKEDATSTLGWRHTEVGKGKYTRDCLEDKEIGTLTPDDTLSIIAFKCTQIFFLGAALYTATAMACNVVITLPLSLVKLCLKTIEEVGKQISILDSALVIGKAVVWDLPKTLLYVIWTVVRAPIFGIGVMFAALCGIFFPMQGRKWVAAVEHAWHDGVDYRMDFRHGMKKFEKIEDEHKKSAQAFKELWEGRFYFLAFCFQPIGNIKDPKTPYKRVIPEKELQNQLNEIFAQSFFSRLGGPTKPKDEQAS